MAESDLKRYGLPPNEQIIMCDRPFANQSSVAADRGGSSRYSPGRGASTHTIEVNVATAPCGKKMGRFAVTQGQTGVTYFNYPLHTEASSLSGEFEAEFVAATAGGTGNVETFVLRTDYGDIALRWIVSQDGDAHAGWRVVYNNAVSQTQTKTFDAAGPSNTGGEHSYRFAYTASSDPDNVADGSFVMYISGNGESILDREAKGGTIAGTVTWTKVIDISHANGPITNIRPQWDDTDAGISNTSNSGMYFRYLALYQTESVPCTITDTTQSWLTMHHYLAEKADFEWDSTANAGAGGWDIKVGINWPDYLFDGSTTRSARLRYWTDYSDLGDNGAASFSDGSWTAFTADAYGYHRDVLVISGVPADTPIWWDIAMQGRGSGDSGVWFYNSTNSPADVHGCYRTPQKPGDASTTPPRVRVSSCFNEKRWGPNEFTIDGATVPVDATGGSRCEFRAFLGDWTYMDETEFSKSSVAKEGAETVTQMKDTIFQLTHSYSVQRANNKVFMRYVGDDHDRSCNDASLLALREEDGTAWNRDRNGTNSGAWSDNVWGKRGVGASNGDYLFPCAIEDDDDEYQIVPRSLAAALMSVARELFHDTLPSDAGSFRYDPSGVDLYGANQGVSTDKLDSNDSQFSYVDMGKVRYLFLDTRLFMDRSNTSAGTLLGAAKTWVESVISGSTLPGLVFCLPGYVQGVGSGASLKVNDNYATSDEVDFTAERTEIFETDVDANSNIKWTGIICGDHHFVTLDTTLSDVSNKHRWQLASGGTQGIRQEPDNIDDTGYRLITDGSDDGGSLITPDDTVRTYVYFEVVNEATGDTRVSASRVANDGLDLLGSFSLKKNQESTARRLMALGRLG